MPELPGEIIENRTVEAGGEEKTEWNSAVSGDVSTIDQHTSQPIVLLRLLPGDEGYVAL
jgi:hypothetical protein